MRISIFLVLGIIMHGLVIAQDNRSVTIDEQFSKAPLSKVVRVLRNKYDVKVVFDDALVTGITINGSYRNMELTDFLDRILPEQGIDYQVLNGKIILIPKQVEIDLDKPSLFDLTVYGVVTDAKTGETLPNAFVRVEGSSLAAITNRDGYFAIPKVPTDTSTLVISYVGYQRNKLKLVPGETRKTLQVTMEENAISLATFTIVEGQERNNIRYGDNITQISINPNGLSSLPSLGELDIFRSLQLLPGISGSSESSSGLNIRSSPSAHNLVLFDGFPIYRLDHFFGVFSAINADAVRDIQVFKGGYDAKYGGRISGVVDITGKTGNFNEPTYNFGINLLSARFSLNAPLDNGRGAVHLSGRRAYTDIIRSNLFEKLYDIYRPGSTVFDDIEAPASPDEPSSNQVRPDFHFYDINFKATYNLTSRDIVSLSIYTGQDELVSSFDDVFLVGDDNNNDDLFSFSSSENGEWGNNGIGAIWSRSWNSNYYSSLQIARSSYFLNTAILQSSSGQGNAFREHSETRDNRISDLQINFRNELSVGKKHTLDFGLNVSHINNTQSVIIDENRDSALSDFDENGTVFSFYGTDKFNLNRKFQVHAGFRYDLNDIVSESFLGHRLALFYKVNPFLQFKFSHGRFYQLVNDIVWDDPRTNNQNFWFLARDENFMFNDPNGFPIPRLRSDHLIGGVQYSRKGWLIDLEYFRKDIDGLIDLSVSHFDLVREPSGLPEGTISYGEGIIEGIDFLLQKNTGNYQGWLAYTLSKAENQFDGVNNGEVIKSRQDQRHEVKMAHSLNLTKWNFSATGIFGSGRNFYTPDLQFITDDQGNVVSYNLRNNNKVINRLPEYFRVDVSAAYKFQGDNMNGEIGFSIFNVTDHRNLQDRRINYNQIEASISAGVRPVLSFTDIRLLDFTPSLFINLYF